MTTDTSLVLKSLLCLGLVFSGFCVTTGYLETLWTRRPARYRRRIR